MSVQVLNPEQLGTLSAYLAAHGGMAAATADLRLEALARANSRSYARRYGGSAGDHYTRHDIAWARQRVRGDVSPLEALRLVRMLNYNVNSAVCEPVEVALIFDFFALMAQAFMGADGEPLRTLCRRRALLGERATVPAVRARLLRRMQSASKRLTDTGPPTELAMFW